MSIVRTQLDGQNLTLALSAPDTFVDLLAVNIVTGDVTSAWLPADWVKFIKQSVALENSVVPPLDRTSLNYLARLVNTLSMDDSVFAGSSVNTAANIYTLRITAVAGVDPAILLVNLPHSITGAFGTADGTQGIAPPVLLAGDVIGASNANTLVVFGPGVVTKGAADKSAVVTTDTKGRVFTLTETSIQIAETQVTNLTTDLGLKADKSITISAGAGLTGGGDLSANRTIAMPNVGTAGTYGNATTVPVLTADAQGRVSGVVNTAITFPAAPTTLSPKLGNVAVVDAVNGNDGTGAVNGLPFRTVEAGVAAITAFGSPATVWIMPGTYTLASATTGLTMPTGCAMRGMSTQTTRIVMNASNPGGTVTLLTMGENSRVEDVTLTLNSSNATTNLIGVNTSGTTSNTSKIRTAVVTVNNASVAAGSTTNVYGIYDNGVGALVPSSFSFNFTRGVTINVFSNGAGNKRGLYVVGANDITFRDTNFYVAEPTDVTSAGSYVGAESADPGCSVQFRTCSIGSAPFITANTKLPVVVAATTNITLSGTYVLQGVTLTAGMQVLAAGQTIGTNNGIWVVAAGAWTRAADMAAGSAALDARTRVYGGTYANTTWTCTTNALVGAAALTFVQLAYTGSDILQTTPGTGFINNGIQIGPGCDLVNKTAGQKPFTTYVTPTTLDYCQFGNIAAATRYMWPGTLNNLDATEVFYRFQQRSILQGMSITLRTAPGAAKPLTITVRRSSTNISGSGFATLMTATLNNTDIFGTQYTVSENFQQGEFLSVQVSGTAGTTAADIVVELDLF
jgi:hypothetical protein